jgi:hypothetical protein
MKLNLFSIYQGSLRLVKTSSMMGQTSHPESQLFNTRLAFGKMGLLQICKLNICAFQRKAPFD